ncbi:MAG: invasin domain 3-containing protein, partial [Gemmatimonadaceae bacterium]
MTLTSIPSRVGRVLARSVGAVVAVVVAGVFACSGDGGTEPVTLDLGRSTLTVAPGPYVAGQSYSATFTARDNNGDPFDDAIAVVFDLVGGTSDGVFSAVSSGGRGVYEASFRATVAGTPSQLTASINGAALSGALPTVTVVPGAVSLATSTIGLGAITLAVGASTTVMVTVRDALGNVRTGGGDAVAFTKSFAGSDGTFSATTDNSNGSYSATFTATVQGTPLQISATVGGQALTSLSATMTVTAPTPSLAQSTVTVAPASIASGSATTVTLTTRSAAGVPLTTTGLTVVFTKGPGTSDGNLSSVTDNGNGTYAATFTGTTAGTA